MTHRINSDVKLQTNKKRASIVCVWRGMKIKPSKTKMKPSTSVSSFQPRPEMLMAYHHFLLLIKTEATDQRTQRGIGRASITQGKGQVLARVYVTVLLDL